MLLGCSNVLHAWSDEFGGCGPLQAAWGRLEVSRKRAGPADFIWPQNAFSLSTHRTNVPQNITLRNAQLGFRDSWDIVSDAGVVTKWSKLGPKVLQHVLCRLPSSLSAFVPKSQTSGRGIGI